MVLPIINLRNAGYIILHWHGFVKLECGNISLHVTSNHFSSLRNHAISSIQKSQSTKMTVWRGFKNASKMKFSVEFGRKLLLTVFTTRLLVNNKKSIDENLLSVAKISLFLPSSISADKNKAHSLLLGMCFNNQMLFS